MPRIAATTKAMVAGSLGFTSNAYAESFNGRLRDECLNESWFLNLRNAQRTIESWRIEYNVARPHSGLAGRTPAAFAEDFLAIAPSP